jgi:hypothetical protein
MKWQMVTDGGRLKPQRFAQTISKKLVGIFVNIFCALLMSEYKSKGFCL